MTTPINSVSPERLDELARWAASEEAECLQDDMPISAGYYADIIKLIAARRAANTPVDGVAWEQAARTFLSGDDFETLHSLAVAFAEDQAAGVDTSLKPASPALPSQVVGDEPEERTLEAHCRGLMSKIYNRGHSGLEPDCPLCQAYIAADRLLSFATDAPLSEEVRIWDANESCLTSPAAEPLTVDDVERIIVETEPASQSDHGDKIWTRRMAVALAARLSHPAPSASREVTVTDEMVLAGCRILHPSLFSRGLEPRPGDGPSTRGIIAEDIKKVRGILTAALAALPEREG